MQERRLLHYAVLFGLTGCVDPGGEFEAFARRSDVSGADAAVFDGGSCTILPGDVEGQYLLALSVTLAPMKPILALVEVTTPATATGTGLSFRAQPLSAADRETPVGDELSLGPFPVDADGSFRAEITGLDVTGAANPVTEGDITADIMLSSKLCGDGRFFCGLMDGEVQRPLPLDLSGSTFTLTRVEDAIPTEPVVDCAGTVADPL